MKKNQFVYSWVADSSKKWSIALGSEVPRSYQEFKIYRLQSSELTPPILIRYGETIWTLDIGHDLNYDSKNHCLHTTNADIVAYPVLIEFGSEVELFCPDGHLVSELSRFCAECGKKITY